jgi:hypothetical protein
MSGDHNRYQKATGYAMNERIRLLAEQADVSTTQDVSYYMGQFDGLTYEQKFKQIRDARFAQLIVEECAKLNLDQSYNLMGVLADMAEPDAEFDRVCLNTVNHVHAYLSGNTLKKHFGVEE